MKAWLIVGALALVAGCAQKGPVAAHTVLDQSSGTLREVFNADMGKTRVLMLVAPTCGVCLKGAAEVNKALFVQHQEASFQGYVVWVPKLGGQEKDVPEATRFASDGRERHFWDEGGRLMAKYTSVLSLPEDAWDIYMVYGPTVRWDEDTPPAPDYWMHQLGSKEQPRVNGPFLDGEVLTAKAVALAKTGAEKRVR